ncbi:MAG: hypothetical protein U0M06_05235 [Clostridia bacterium]|nr:hypothetical protein [Clostridia bacterium]
MATEEKKGITVKVDADLHAEVRQYLEQNGMTMGEFVAIALHNELHPKISEKEDTQMGNMRTLAFQVPEELFQKIKDYCVEETSIRNNKTETASQEIPFGRPMAIRTEKENATQIYAEVSIDDNSLDVAVLVGDDSLVTLNVSTDGENILIRKWVGYGDSEDDSINIRKPARKLLRRK